MKPEFLRAAAHTLKSKLRARRDALPPVVLCADDDEGVRTLCAAVLARAGFRTDTARDGREALDRIEESDYDAILLDLDMPRIHGATVLSIVGSAKPALLRRLVILTALPDAAVAELASSVGAVLRKPLRNDALVQAVRRCCDQLPRPVQADASLTVRL